MDLTENTRRESFPADADTTVHLHLEHADVVVRHEPTDTATVTVSCREDVPLDAVELTTAGRDITVRVPPIEVDPSRRGPSIDLGFMKLSLGGARVKGLLVEVVLPEGAGVMVAAKSGDTRIEGRCGRARVRTGKGDLHAESVDLLEAGHGSGDIDVRDVGELKVMGGAGDVTVDRIREGGNIRSGVGELTLRHVSGNLETSSGSGGVRVGLFDGGTLTVRAASGDVTVGLPTGVPIWQDLQSMSGDVRADLQSAGQPVEGEAFITVRASTASGDIRLHNA